MKNMKRTKTDCQVSIAEVITTLIFQFMWLWVIIPYLGESKYSWTPIPREETVAAVAVLLPITVFWAETMVELHKPLDVID